MRAGLEVVPPTTGPGVVTLRKAQEFAERALGPRAPLGELKAAAVVRVRVPENLLAPREWRPPLRRAAGGAAQSAQHHQRCAQKPQVLTIRANSIAFYHSGKLDETGGRKTRLRQLARELCMERPARHRSSPMELAKRLNPLAQQHCDPFSKHGLWRCDCTESEQ